jgi:hypothetical protein
MARRRRMEKEEVKMGEQLVVEVGVRQGKGSWIARLTSCN